MTPAPALSAGLASDPLAAPETPAKPPRPRQSLEEEIWNAATHGLGLLLSVAGVICLLAFASRATPRVWTGLALYGGSLCAVFASSTLYHAFRADRIKHLFRVLDHCCIYLLIAGSYTPLVLMYLPTTMGWTVLCAVWALAMAGLVHKIFFIHRLPGLSLATYLVMGWLSILQIGPMIRNVPAGALAWIVAGGLLYTGGAVFYAMDHRRYFHTIWHVFVLAAAACHFVAMLFWVAMA